MIDFFPIETPYDSKDYQIMKNVVDKGIDSHLEGFTKSKFTKSPHWNNKFLWNIHESELPILYRRLEELYAETGDEDYDTFLDEIRSAADTTKSAIHAGEYKEEEIDESLGTLGLSYDKEGSEFPGVEENSSDSLVNQHGENLKPETIAETTDQERYEDIIFLQGQEADETMDILNNDGRDAAMAHLMQWHYPGEHMGRNELPHGTQDKTYEKDGYIMAWNPHLPYIGLTYDTHHLQAAPEVDEDSQRFRHTAGQREKEAPLGQHSPHSQSVMEDESAQVEPSQVELPQNKPSIHNKFKTKNAIKSAVYQVLEKDKVEGRYADENWQGISKLKKTLENNNIEVSLLGAKYEGTPEFSDSTLPTRKVYLFELHVRDKEGKNVPLQMKVTCSFIGKTGTMVDHEYELTYYFI